MILGRLKTSRTGTALSDGSDGTVTATARRTRALRPLQITNVVRQLQIPARNVPSGMPATVAIDMPDKAIGAARFACRSGTSRIAMLTPMAQNVPLAKPMTRRTSA